MKELVIVKKVNKKDVPVTTTKIIADEVGKSHRSIYLLVEKFKNDFEIFGRVSSQMTPFDTKGGPQNLKIYILNEQQTTLLITYLRNNKRVREFKIKLVQQFYEMKEFIQQKQTDEWKGAREDTKKFNRTLTDAIKDFVEYAESQGSKSYNRYYKIYADLVNKCLNIESGNRNNLSPDSMRDQTFISKFLEKEIYKGITDNTHYKQIYKNCKDKVDYFMECFGLKLKA